MFSTAELLTLIGISINTVLIIGGWYVVNRRERSKIVIPRNLAYIDEIISGLNAYNRSFVLRVLQKSHIGKHLEKPISKADAQKITIDMIYYDQLAKVFCSQEVSQKISSYMREAIDLLADKSYHEDRSNRVISMFGEIISEIQKDFR